MNSAKKLFIATLALTVFAAALFVVPFAIDGVRNNAEAVEAVSYSKGSTGDVVKQIQTKLKTWGYYTGSVDGIYGSKTYNAVRSFQEVNGLTVDGVVGNQTAKAMGISLGGSANSYGSSDLYLLAKCVYGEARGEPYIGQVAVAAVVLNRVKSASFPNTIAGVIYQSGAFTAVSDGQINLTPNESAKNAALDAMNGWDPSNGCLYYYNPATATSKWIWSRPIMLVIGKHNFCA